MHNMAMFRIYCCIHPTDTVHRFVDMSQSRMKSSHPTLNMHIECYHYEKRTTGSGENRKFVLGQCLWSERNH